MYKNTNIESFKLESLDIWSIKLPVDVVKDVLVLWGGGGGLEAISLWAGLYISAIIIQACMYYVSIIVQHPLPPRP